MVITVDWREFMKKILSLILALILCLSLTTPMVSYAATTKLSKSKLSIHMGETYKLKLSNTSGTITWASSEASIAKVSSGGKITALSEGKTVITATCENKDYTCAVTVESNKTVDIIYTAYIFNDITIDQYAKDYVKDNHECLKAEPYDEKHITVTMYESDHLKIVKEFEKEFDNYLPSLTETKDYKGIFTEIKADKLYTEVTVYANAKKFNVLTDGFSFALLVGLLSDSIQTLYLIAPEDRKCKLTILNNVTGEVLYPVE